MTKAPDSPKAGLHHRAAGALIPAIKAKISGGMIAGLFFVATGFGPDEWFKRLFAALHLPEYLAAGLKSFDPRVALVGIGVILIGIDILLRHSRHKTASRSGSTDVLAKPAASLTRTATDTLSSSLNEQPKELPLPDRPSIAVLPFQNLSGDPEQEYYADGIVEDIITGLSRFKSLFVIARNSSFTYRAQAVDIKRVGRELGVRYVLEGSIRKAGGRIRITGQLIEAETNAHLWADKFDGGLNDLFDLQDKITADVVRAIAPAIERAEIERPRTQAVDRLDSYDLCLRARATLRRGNPSEAYSLSKQAIELSPDYVLAHAMIAYALVVRNADGEVLPPATREEALQHARTAISMGSADGASLAIAASIISVLGHEYERAETLIEQALELNPNSSSVWLSGGWVAINGGAFEIALDRFTQVLRFSPFDPGRGAVWYGIAAASSALRKYDEGCAAAIKAIQFAPAVHSYGAFIINAVPTGRLAEARDALSKLMSVRPSFRLSHVPPVFHTRDPEWMGRMVAAFKEAGLPE
jgi:TolB-like protein